LASEEKKGHAVPGQAEKVVGKARKVAMEAVAEAEETQGPPVRTEAEPSPGAPPWVRAKTADRGGIMEPVARASEGQQWPLVYTGGRA
jgi:hypothetical protein